MHNNTIKRFGLSAVLAVLAICLIPISNAVSMGVTPIIMELTATGISSKSSIRVVNDSKRKLPVEILISRLEIGPKGEQKLEPAGEEFLIFPPQALIPIGATQNFRIQWVGKPDITKSQSYIFSVNQVPVKMPKGTSGVQMVFNFGTIVNVAPVKGVPSIEFVKADVTKDQKGQRRPAVTVRNKSNVHASLSDATIKLSGKGWSQKLTPSVLKQRLGYGLIQPGKTRRLVLPTTVPNTVSSIKANIDYTPKKRK